MSARRLTAEEAAQRISVKELQARLAKAEGLAEDFPKVVEMLRYYFNEIHLPEIEKDCKAFFDRYDKELTP